MERLCKNMLWHVHGDGRNNLTLTQRLDISWILSLELKHTPTCFHSLLMPRVETYTNLDLSMRPSIPLMSVAEC